MSGNPGIRLRGQSGFNTGGVTICGSAFGAERFRQNTRIIRGVG